MLIYKKVAVIDHDWSLYRIYGMLGTLKMEGDYAIIHDDDVVDPAFWESLDRVYDCLINSFLGKRLEKYYE